MMNQTIGRTTTRLNLRAGPGTDYNVLRVLESGTMIVVLEDQGTWLNIQAAGTTGFVQEKFISLPNKPDTAEAHADQAPLSADSTGVVTTYLNLRRGPGLEYSVIRTLEEGSALDVLEDMGNWLNVHFRGTFGYVMGRFVDWEPQEYFEEPMPQAPDPELDLAPDSQDVRPVEVSEQEQAAEPEEEQPDSKSAGDQAAGEAPVEEPVAERPEVEEPSPVDESGPVLLEAPPLPIGIHTFGSLDQLCPLRAGPGQDFPVLKEVPGGLPFLVLEDTGTWLKVQAGQALGYVHGAGVSLANRLIAEVRTAVEVRSGPGTEYEALCSLAVGDTVPVLEDLGNWLEISAPEQRGFVPEHVLERPEEGRNETESEPSTLAVAADDAADPAEAEAVSKSPTLLAFDPQAPLIERLIADTWNRFADLILEFTATTGIDPAVAASVLAFETVGRSFDRDGRLLIRFENHVFWHFWGKRNQVVFDDHFQFDPDFPGHGHRFRTDPESTWQGVHGESQDTEWQAYELAAAFDRSAARLSTSLGAPQIMGFNYAAVGFGGVDDMWEAFRAGESQQVAGFFKFLQGSDSSAGQIAALQQRDYAAFARLYNGEGLAKKYGARIHVGVELFNLLARP